MNGGGGHKAPDDALRALLEELGGLRNANARDPVFKAWRQNTLTLVQRVWADDTTRAERFRRVPFSPPSSKSNATVRRQYFERGCSEAIWLLREWIEDARRNGLTFSDAGRRSAPAMPGSQEDDFPVLDLPADGSTVSQVSNDFVNTKPMAPEAAPRPETPPRAPGARSEAPRPPLVSPFAEPIDLPPALPAAPPPPKPAAHAKPAKPQEPARPAPPKQSPASKPAAAPAAKQPPAPKAPPPKPAAPPPPAPAPAASAPGYEAELDAAFDAFMDPKDGRKSRRDSKRGGAPKRALKEMLGFTDDAMRAAPEEPIAYARTPEPAAEAPGEPEVPHASEPAEDPPFEIVPPPAAPEPPIAFVRPPADASGANGPAPEGASLPKPRYEEGELPEYDVTAEDLEALRSLIDKPEAIGEVAGPAAARDTAAEEAAEMQDFLDRSPVFGASPRPAPPRPAPSRPAPPPPAPSRPAPPPTPAVPMRSPTATTLASLASELGHLGVAEGQRVAVRAMLLDLAREFDDNRASWDRIRHAVVFVMEYPPLARRVLPLLIPYLDQAA